MKPTQATLLLLVFLCLDKPALLGAVDASKLPPAASVSVDFVSDVQPILEKYCLSCHGPEKPKGRYRVDVSTSALTGGDTGPNILPGNSGQSPLIHYVAGLVPDMVMPAKGDRLTADEIGLLRAWIDQGANWPEEAGAAVVQADTTEHWSFRKPIRPELPAVKNKRWPRTPVDHFILAKLEEKNLAPSREADRISLLRRVKFNLLGLPPSPGEVTEFLSDKRPDAYERLIERLLASPHYGERWARHWLDVIRFAESDGFETNLPRPNAWPYRDYVIEAFNSDKPYDRFVIEQLAGDQFDVDAATAFLVAGPWDRVKSPDVVLTRQQRMDELFDMVSTTGSVFLGLTVGCARCHNHKFDPISQVDYYAMQAMFAGVQHGEREMPSRNHEDRLAQANELQRELAAVLNELHQFEPIADPSRAPSSENDDSLRAPVHPRLNVDRFHPVTARFVRFTVLQTNNREPCIDELEIYTAEKNTRNVALADAGAKAFASSTYPNSSIHKLEHVNDGKVGNERSWISNEPGKGWVQIELPEAVLIDRVVWGRDRNEKYNDRLATQYRIEVATEPENWNTVASSDDRHPHAPKAKPRVLSSAPHLTPREKTRAEQLLNAKETLDREVRELTAVPKVYAGRFETPPATHRLHRGDPMQERETVSPGALSQFGPPFALSPEAPDPERRLALARWIVDPENPMTARVLVNRLWQYHFGEGLVKTPSDFGINGASPSHPELLDWLATEFITRGWSIKEMHRVILLSSAYRQSSRPNPKARQIDAGNQLLWRYAPRRLEAESIRDGILWASGKLDLAMGGPGFDLFEPNDNYVKVYTSKKDFSPAEFRRLIYQSKPRMQLDDTFGAFDCPDAGQAAPRRTSSTTPLQAFNLLNSPFVFQQAAFFAERLEREAGGKPKAQARHAFKLLFNREPDRSEIAAAVKLIQDHGLPQFCRALFNTNEFLYVF